MGISVSTVSRRIQRLTTQDIIQITAVNLRIESGQFSNNERGIQALFSEPFPARICYGVSLVLPKMLIEIDAIAYVGK